jgi:hypothetical protein
MPGGPGDQEIQENVPGDLDDALGVTIIKDLVAIWS